MTDADPTTAVISKLLADESFVSGMASNGITIVLLGSLWALKKLCSRPSKCKSHIHTCCIDIEVADRSGNTIRQPPITSDEADRVSPVTDDPVHQKPVGSLV